jgi:hypothetical protein
MAFMNERAKFLAVLEFCATYGVGRTRAYEEMSAGRLGSVRVGRRRFVPTEAAERWHQERLAEAIAAGDLRPEHLEPLDPAA